MLGSREVFETRLVDLGRWLVVVGKMLCCVDGCHLVTTIGRGQWPASEHIIPWSDY